SAILLVYTAGRAYREFPALDRSADRRPAAVLSALTKDLDDQHAILLADFNWRPVNGLAYFGKVSRPDLAYAWMSDVLIYAPALVADNVAIDRDVALTDRARTLLAHAYGPLLPVAADPRINTPTLTQIVQAVSPGTPYVLCLLRPSRDFALDRQDLASAIHVLAGRDLATPSGDYAAIVGIVGRPPDLAVDSATPFRRSANVGATAVEVRMESWLTFDTIRRMGFGQVVAAHHHTLIIERGVSFAAFDAEGRAVLTAYAANIFAP